MTIKSRHVLIDYTNHAGVRQQRTIVPDEAGIFFGSSQWHGEGQWLLNAFDVGKGAARTFALASIHSWLPADGRPARVERSLAKQLQDSMERSARMVNRLKRLQVKCDDCKPRNPVMGDIGCIIRDEDF